MWILHTNILVAQICSLGLESVKARKVNVGQELMKKKKRKPKCIAQYLQRIIEMQRYSLLMCTEQQTPMFFITAVWGWEGWSGEGQAKQLPALHYNSVLLCGRQQEPLTKPVGLRWDLGIRPERTVQLLQRQQKRSIQSSRGKQAASLGQMPLHSWVSPPAQPACLGGAGSSRRPSNQKFSSPLRIPPQWYEAEIKDCCCFPCSGTVFYCTWNLDFGIGKIFCKHHFPSSPNSKNSLFLTYPLCRAFWGDLVTSLFFVQMHRWEALFLWIFLPNSFLQVLFTFFHLPLFLGYLLKHH